MPLYKVEATKTLWPENHNPFNKRSAELLFGKVQVSIKSWEFEAKNAAEVKRLWQEAIDTRISEVAGYKLGTITELQAIN